MKRRILFTLPCLVLLAGCASSMALKDHFAQETAPMLSVKTPVSALVDSEVMAKRSLGYDDIGFGKRPSLGPKAEIAGASKPSPKGVAPSEEATPDESWGDESSEELAEEEDFEESGAASEMAPPEADEDSAGILIPKPAEVKIFIDGNGRGVASCDLSILYDPAIVAIETVTSEAFIPGEGTILADVQKPGLVRVVGFTIRSETRGADAAIANVRFRAIMAGATTIKVVLRQAADANDDVIDDATIRLSSGLIDVRLR